jgi:hypothetical protein
MRYLIRIDDPLLIFCISYNEPDIFPEQNPELF